jgi:hypothetical protein
MEEEEEEEEKGAGSSFIMTRSCCDFCEEEVACSLTAFELLRALQTT